MNDISRAGIGFDSADNEVVILLPDEERRVTRGPKPEVAQAVLDVVEELRARDESAPLDAGAGKARR
jgi:hypothetical protein